MILGMLNATLGEVEGHGPLGSRCRVGPHLSGDVRNPNRCEMMALGMVLSREIGGRQIGEIEAQQGPTYPEMRHRWSLRPWTFSYGLPLATQPTGVSTGIGQRHHITSEQSPRRMGIGTYRGGEN